MRLVMTGVICASTQIQLLDKYEVLGGCFGLQAVQSDGQERPHLQLFK